MGRGCAIAVVLVALAAPAQARPRLEVDAGFEGTGYPNAHLPVRVAIHADTLVRGTLELSVGDWSLVVVRPVEVAGGTTSDMTELIPLAHSGVITVTLRDEDGQALASADTTVDVSYDHEMVGLLPDALGSRPLPGSVPLAVDAGTARFTALDPALLERAPLGLFGIGTIGATAADLEALTDDQRMGILRWIAGGGRLLLDAETAPALPEEWTPGADGRVLAGLGEVVFTGDAIRNGRLSGLVEPTLRVPTEHVLERVAHTSPTTDALPQLGNTVPPLGWLFGAAALYALAVGPLLFLLLRRRRREAAMWVVVPVAAAVLTAVSYGSARLTRGNDIRTAHRTVLTSAPFGAVASSYTVFSSPTGGEIEASYPGWPWLTGGTIGGGDGSGTPTRIVSAPDGVSAHVPLNPGQVAAVGGAGPTREEGLEIEATSRDGRIEGVVRNRTPYVLEEAAVVVGDEGVRLGPLDPGAARRWEVDGGPAHHADSIGSRLWPQLTPRSSRVYGLNRTSAHSPVSWSLWERLGNTSPDVVATGEALAVGWTTEHRLPIALSGDLGRAPGTTLVVARTPVDHVSGPVPANAVSRRQVRGPLPVQEPGGLQPTPFGVSAYALQTSTATIGPVVLRFVLPSGADTPRDMVLSAPTELSSLETWSGDEWILVAEGPPPAGGPTILDPSAMTDHRVGVVGRVVWVRATLHAETPWTAGAFTLREATPTEEAVPDR